MRSYTFKVHSSKELFHLPAMALAIGAELRSASVGSARRLCKTTEAIFRAKSCRLPLRDILRQEG